MYNFSLDKLLAGWYNGKSAPHLRGRRAQKFPIKKAKKVEEIYQQFGNMNAHIQMQIEKLKEYKTTLINDAVTGKIKVA